MTARPKRFLIYGPKVFTLMTDAPPAVKATFQALLIELSTAPYPDQRSNVANARGTDRNHCYVAWKDNVEVMYLVMQDQPVISLVGVHWRDPGGDDDGDDGEPVDWTWSLAA